MLFQLTSSRRGWPTAFKALDTISIFQLTSSRRGWLDRITISLVGQHFNSHPHEEDDRRIKRWINNGIISTHILTKRMTWRRMKMKIAKGISTHILTKRMTSTWSWQEERRRYFNSHPHEEDDGCEWLAGRGEGIFQLTSSRRGWLISFQFLTLCRIFQLTSSRRGWHLKSSIQIKL